VEWAAALPHSNGKVGMFGGSYVGATQMLAAIGHPPHLAGICPIVTASNYHENWTYQGGAFEQWFNESWTSGLAQDTLDRAIRHDTNALVGSTVLPLKQYPVFNIGAAQDGAALTRTLAPYFLDWLAHPTYDSYWKQWSIEENYAEHPGSRAHHRRLVRHLPGRLAAQLHGDEGPRRQRSGAQRPAPSRRHRRPLRLGPQVGEVDFGPDAPFDENASSSTGTTISSWASRTSLPTGKPVKIFVMGKNEWRFEDAWPLERAKNTRYFCSVRRITMQTALSGTWTALHRSDQEFL
jgi:uncharacterized protein